MVLNILAIRGVIKRGTQSLGLSPVWWLGWEKTSWALNYRVRKGKGSKGREREINNLRCIDDRRQLASSKNDSPLLINLHWEMAHVLIVSLYECTSERHTSVNIVDKSPQQAAVEKNKEIRKTDRCYQCTCTVLKDLNRDREIGGGDA